MDKKMNKKEHVLSLPLLAVIFLGMFFIGIEGVKAADCEYGEKADGTCMSLSEWCAANPTSSFCFDSPQLPGQENNGGVVSGGCGGGEFEEIGGVCFPKNTKLSEASVSDILWNILSWLLSIFAAIAIIAFIISGIQYLTSAGNTEQAEKAKQNAIYAILGVIIGLSGFLIVKAIQTALSGRGSFF